MINFTFALVLSLIAHAAVIGVAWMDQSPSAGQAAPATPAPIYSPAPVRADVMGETSGTGHAANSSPGEIPQQARKAEQQQAALGRNPPGMNQAAPSHPPEPSTPKPIPPLTPPRQPTAASTRISPAALQQPHWTPDVPEVPAPPKTSSAIPPGDPYPQSDSESDPFAKVEHVEMHNGRVDAKFGRKVKTVRPRFGLAAENDLTDHARLSVVLKVRTDATGKVTQVDVIRSSGSVPVDLAVQLSMYNWWIQPPSNKQGHPIPDVMVWKVTFQ